METSAIDSQPSQVEMEEQQAKSESLAKAKDRAQLTATGAMSVVHIAILREIVDAGQEGNPYYIACIVLISLALILQVFNGITSLFVLNLKSYYSAYSGNIMEDIWSNLCCFRIVKKSQVRKQKKTLHAGSKEALDYIDEELESRLCTCCPYELTTTALDDQELDVLSKYDHWYMMQTRLELMNEKADMDLMNLVELTQAATTELAELENSKEDATTEETRRKAGEIQKKISTAQKQRHKYETVMRDKEISDKQGELLKKKADTIRRKQVYKMAEFWQGVITNVFYVIFVINMFITAFAVGTTNSALITALRNQTSPSN